MLARQRRVRVLLDAHVAAAYGAQPVRRRGNEVELVLRVDLPREIREDHEDAVHQSDDDHVAPRVVPGNLRR